MPDADDAHWIDSHEPAMAALRSVAGHDAGSGDRDAADATLRTLARRICDTMGSDGARPERVIVRLKRAWAALPEAAALERNRRNDLLEQLVSLCIDEYSRAAPTRLAL
jgi:hypothetical protein